MMCLLASCGGPPSAPEQEIRDWVGVAQQAAESRARRQLMSLVSPGYTDARGYERDDIETLLRVYFLRLAPTTAFWGSAPMRISFSWSLRKRTGTGS